MEQNLQYNYKVLIIVFIFLNHGLKMKKILMTPTYYTHNSIPITSFNQATLGARNHQARQTAKVIVKEAIVIFQQSRTINTHTSVIDQKDC